MGNLVESRKYRPLSSCSRAGNPLLLGRNRSGELTLTIAFACSPKACKASKSRGVSHRVTRHSNIHTFFSDSGRFSQYVLKSSSVPPISPTHFCLHRFLKGRCQLGNRGRSWCVPGSYCSANSSLSRVLLRWCVGYCHSRSGCNGGRRRWKL